MEKQEINGIFFIADKWPLDSEKPTLFFIHGASGSNILWHEQITDISKIANTIALDLPGHGKSKGSGKESIGDYANAVMGLIQKIDIPKPILCGLSMGGAITQQLILDNNKYFSAAILISTGAKLKVMPLIFDLIKTDYSRYVDMLRQFAVSEKTDSKRLMPIFEETMKCPMEVSLGDFRACDAFDVTDKLETVEIPVLIVTGEDDKLTPKQYGDFFESKIKNSKRIHIMDAGHLVPVEKPDKVNIAISDFLNKFAS